MTEGSFDIFLYTDHPFIMYKLLSQYVKTPNWDDTFIEKKMVQITSAVNQI